MFVVNFKEIPEFLSVETRFITKAAAQQKKDKSVFYMNVNRSGHIELAKQAVSAPQQTSLLTNLSAVRGVKPMVTVSLKNKPMIISKPITVPSLMSNANMIPPPPSQYITPISNDGIASVTPFGLSMSAPYNAKMFPDSQNFVGGCMPPITQMPAAISTMTMPVSNPILPNINCNPPQAIMRTSVQMKDSACMTEPKAQGIHRGQQTDETTLNTMSVAVQCSIDDEFDNGNEVPDNFDQNNQSLVVEISEGEQKEEFLQYVKQHSVEYKNHFRECLICGEVCKNPKYFYRHMAVHRGPKMLCFVCGQYLDHEALMKTHNCISTKRISRALLRCPYNKCQIVAISRLELYDHINEHKNYRVHKCTVCHKSFCTAQEFLRHLLLRAKCYTDAKRNPNSLYGLKSRSDRLCRVRVFTLHSYTKQTTMVKSLLATRTPNNNLCNICFRRYRNKFIFGRHMKKCLAIFKKQSTRNRKAGMK